MRPLSYSSILTYEGCPLRWKFKYVDGAPADDVPAPESLRLGKAMHEALEAYHRPSGGPSAAWRKLRNADVDDESASAGADMLRRFQRREARRGRDVVAVEKPFRIDLDGIPFVGVIDRIEAVGDKVAVVDYKSGPAPPRPWLPRKSAQLGYYQMGAEHGLGLDVDHLAIEHLRSGLRFSAERRAPEQLQGLKDRAADVWDAARSGAFPATPNRDCPCEFARRCPYYRDLYPTILDWDGDARERVADAVEAYAGDRDADARAVIEAHFERHGTLRAWGRTHVVERTPGGLLRVRPADDVERPAGAA